MKQVSLTIKQCLDNKRINYQYNEEQNDFYFNVRCELTDLDFYIQVHGDEYISFIAGLPITIPKESYANVCQTLNEINADTMITSLYLHKPSRKIYGQSFAIAIGGEIHEDVIMHNIGLTMNTLDSRAEEIFRVAFGNCNDDTLAQLFMRQDAHGNPILN